MTQRAIVPINQPGAALTPPPTRTPTFDELVDYTGRMVADSSARVYDQTYRKWRAWCDANGISPLDWTPGNVDKFFASQDVTKSTRQRQLSALRKLAEMYFLLTGDVDSERLYKALRMMKVGSKGGGNERARRALTPAQVDRVLRMWQGGSLLKRRNRALIAVLFLSGLRRSEAAALRWADVDLSEGVLHVRHGKGDKVRDAALMGDSAITALRAWQKAQGKGREYVFCPLRKGGNLGPDAPMTDTDVYRVVAKTSKRSGVKFSPHDARRTLLTEYLETGGSLADAQAQAGHAQSSTTLGYAMATDARERRRKARLRYG